jgi:hypothetical protein
VFVVAVDVAQAFDSIQVQELLQLIRGEKGLYGTPILQEPGYLVASYTQASWAVSAVALWLLQHKAVPWGTCKINKEFGTNPVLPG